MSRILPTILFAWLITHSALALNKPSLQFTHRLRIETWDEASNLLGSATSTCYTRQRSTLGLKWALPNQIEFGLRMTHEFRYYIVPASTPFNRDELVVDNLFVKWKFSDRLPLTTTVGRFNMMFGEGFVVMDPSPLDGSRTAYFNAVRSDYALDSLLTISAFYTKMNRVDRALPIINNQHKVLVEQPEEGYGLYLTKIVGGLNLQGYALRMNSGATSALARRITSTIGGRIEYQSRDGWFAVTEDASQFGKQRDYDRRSLGGYLRVGRDFTKPKFGLNQALIGVVYLSGDDRYTQDVDESWRPLWGRWPKWSESFVYALIPERGVATWANFTSVYTQLILKPALDTRIKLSAHRLGSAINNGHPSYGSDKLRGVLLTGMVEYKVFPGLTGHFLWEKFAPGGFYRDDAKSYVWLRSELFYTFDLKM